MKKFKLEYKWVMVALCFIMVGVSLGFCSSPGQLYITAITDALKIPRSAYTVTNTCRFISTSVINLFFGTFIARFGPKKLISAGFACLIIATLIYSFAETLPMFYLGGLIIGIGFSWTTTTMIGYVVNIWCRENKGTIMGAILASNGIFGAVAMQLITNIMYRTDDPFGYRNAYRAVAIILLVVAAIVIIFFKTSPNDTDSSNISKKKSRGRSWVGIEYSEATKKTYFYLALICIFLTGMTLHGVSGVSAPHMKDVGLSPEYVATVLSLHSISLSFFKFLTGFLYDKFGLKVTSGICYLTGAGVMLALALVTNSPTGRVLAMIYGIFSSLALPLETIMLPIFAGDLFGEKSFGKILGIFVSVNTLCYDLTGSYSISLYTCVVLILLITAVMQFVITRADRTRREIEQQ